MSGITIEIDGIGRVRLDDSFRSLTPEQQDQTIQDIARQRGQGGGADAPPVTRSETLVRNAGQGFLFGSNDEARAAEAASGLYPKEFNRRAMLADPIGMGVGMVRQAAEAIAPSVFGTSASERYDDQLEYERDRLAQGMEEYPVTSVAGAIAGGAANPINYLAPAGIRQGAGFLTNTARAGAASVPFTAAYGFGEGEGGFGERAVNAAKTTAIGAPVAGVLGSSMNAAGSALSRARQTREAAESAGDIVRQQFDEFGITPTRPELTGRADDFAEADSIARGGYGDRAQNVANEAMENRQAQVSGSRDLVGARLGLDEQGRPIGPAYGTTQDAASDLRNSIEMRAQQAQRAQQADDAAWGAGVDRMTEAGRVGLAGRGRDIARDDVDVGEAVIGGVRSASDAAKTAFRSAYRDALNRDGTFSRDFVKGMGRSIRDDLTNADEPVIIVAQDMPSANAALNLVDEFSQLSAPVNRADARGMPAADDIAGVNLRGIEQVRKQIQSLYRGASNPSDKRAVSRIISAFDNQLENAMSSGMFTGDDAALDALRGARSQFRNYAQTFGVRAPGDDAGANLRKILERDATPNEAANFLYGSSRIGSTGGAVRTARRMRDILGPDSDEWLAVRQGAYQRLLQTGPDGMTPKAARQIADRIEDFSTGRGRVLAQEMFDDTERETLRKLSGHLRTFANRDNAQPEAMQTLIDIAQKNLSPDDLARRFAQQGSPGATSTNQRLAMAVKDVFGPESPEMSAVRQLTWRQLSSRTPGTTQRGEQSVSSRVFDFLDGSGKELSRQLYTSEQRDLMRRYANVLARMVPPPRTQNFSGSGDRAADKVLPRLSEMLSATLGGTVAGGPGAAAGYAGSLGWSAFRNARNAKNARRLFAGDNPAARVGLSERLLRGAQGASAAGAAGTPAAASSRGRQPAALTD